MLSLEKLKKILARIPRGKVATYGGIARALGTPKAYRAVGTLCGKNDRPDLYPCYKVVRSDGTVGGYILGTAEKIRRLKKDGVQTEGGRIKHFKERVFKF